MTRRVVIDTLRINGLAGAQPTRAEVEAAVRRALAGQPVGEAVASGSQRVTRPAGTTLGAAAEAATAALFRKPRP